MCLMLYLRDFSANTNLYLEYFFDIYVPSSKSNNPLNMLKQACCIILVQRMIYMHVPQISMFVQGTLLHLVPIVRQIIRPVRVRVKTTLHRCGHSMRNDIFNAITMSLQSVPSCTQLIFTCFLHCCILIASSIQFLSVQDFICFYNYITCFFTVQNYEKIYGTLHLLFLSFHQ